MYCQQGYTISVANTVDSRPVHHANGGSSCHLLLPDSTYVLTNLLSVQAWATWKIINTMPKDSMWDDTLTQSLCKLMPGNPEGPWGGSWTMWQEGSQSIKFQAANYVPWTIVPSKIPPLSKPWDLFPLKPGMSLVAPFTSVLAWRECTLTCCLDHCYNMTHQGRCQFMNCRVGT